MKYSNHYVYRPFSVDQLLKGEKKKEKKKKKTNELK